MVQDRTGTSEAHWTALHYAVKHGRVELAKLLHNRGADPTLRWEGKTAATLAFDPQVGAISAFAHHTCARTLLQRNAERVALSQCTFRVADTPNSLLAALRNVWDRCVDTPVYRLDGDAECSEWRWIECLWGTASVVDCRDRR